MSNLFDSNGDGHMSSFEKANEYNAYESTSGSDDSIGCGCLSFVFSFKMILCVVATFLFYGGIIGFMEIVFYLFDGMEPEFTLLSILGMIFDIALLIFIIWLVSALYADKREEEKKAAINAKVYAEKYKKQNAQYTETITSAPIEKKDPITFNDIYRNSRKYRK